jgi:hypothetical protein
MGQFGSRPRQKPDLMTLGRLHLDPYVSTHGFCRDGLDVSVPISGLEFRISHLWLYSEMLLLIIKYWHRYVKVHLGGIGHLNDQNEKTHVRYYILKMSIIRARMIIGHASWVILGGDMLNTVMNIVLATNIAKRESEMLPTPSWNWASMEYQWFCVMPLQ